MKTKFSLKAISAAALLTTPWIANASLDGVAVQSRLGEPFSAIIALSGAEAQTALDQPGIISVSGNAQFSVRVTQYNNTPVLLVRSARPIRDPIASFTVKVGSASRKYSAIIDPPAPPNASANKSVRTSIPVEQQAGSSTRVASGDIRLGHSYKTQPEDTVISIARRIKPDRLTLGQTMRAITIKNPHAFRNGNPNQLISGITIRIPNEAELANPSAARVDKKTTPAAGKPDIEKPTVSNTPKPEKTVENKTEPKPIEAKPVETPPPVEATPSPVITTQPTTSETETSEAENTNTGVISSETTLPSEEIPPPPVEVKPEVVATPPAETSPPPQESTIDWMAWLPYGGGALVTLLLAGFLLSRRGKSGSKPAKVAKQKPVKTKPNKNDFVPTSDEFHPLPSAAAVSTPAVAIETFDDDDITFDTTPVAHTPPVSPTMPPANITPNIPVLTEEAPVEDFAFPDQGHEAASSFMQAESFIDELSKPTINEDSNTLFDFSDTEATNAAQSTAPVLTDNVFDFDFDAGQATPEISPRSHATPPTPSQNDGDSTFDFDFAMSAPAPTQPATAAVTPSHQEEDVSNTFDFDFATAEPTPTVAKPSTPEPFTQPVVEETADDFNFDFETSSPATPVAPTISAPADHEEFISFAEPEAPTTNAGEVFFDMQDSPLSVEDTPSKPRRAPSVEDQLAEGEKQKLAFDPSIGLSLSLADEPSFNIAEESSSQETTTDFIANVDEMPQSVVSNTATPLAAQELSFELEEPEPALAPAPTPPAAAEIEFDLSQPATPANHPSTAMTDLEFTPTKPATESVSATQAAASSHASHNIEFELSEPSTMQTDSVAAITPPQAQAAPAAAMAPISDDAPLQSKLELAKMYLSMDDIEGAVETLYDLMDNCDENNAIYQAAEKLLATVPQPA